MTQPPQPPDNAGYPPDPAGQYPPPAPAGPPQQPPGQFQQQPPAGPGQFQQQPPAGPGQFQQQPPAGPGLNNPQPAGGPGFNAPTAAAFNPANVAKADWIVLGVGVLMLIFSFFGWYSVSSSFGGGSLGGWNRWWIIIQLVLLAILVIKAVQIFTGNLTKEVPGIALVGAGALIVVLSLIALIENFANSTSETDGGFTISAGPGFGIWAYLILSIVFTYGLALVAQKDGKLPFKVPSIAGL